MLGPEALSQADTHASDYWDQDASVGQKIQKLAENFWERKKG